MTEIVGAFTAFSQRSNNKDGVRQVPMDDSEPIEREPFQFDPEELKKISGKDRRWAWAEIDLHAVRYNCIQMKRLVSHGRHMMAVVSADAYGHGAVEVAKAALSAGADHLAVATIDEAIVLREALVNAPILVLSEPPISAIPLFLAYKVMPSIYSLEFAVQYGEKADEYGLKAPYHFVINSGMNRIGVRFDQAVDFMSSISFHRALECKGVFTEFATTSRPEDIDFQLQVNRFVEAIRSLQAAGFSTGLVHCADTTVALRYPNMHFDMVRTGIALYGLYPSPELRGVIDLRPVMSVHARITDMRNVPVGEGVGFGLNYRSAGSARVCTLPLGYADGYPRMLSGRTTVLYQGQVMRQVGDICMDQCMIEVDLRTRAGRPRLDPQIGDEVVFVGRQGDSSITIDELAGQCGTINYEICCGFGQRLPKIYV